MDYSHNSSKNENKTMRHGQIYTFYPEFNQKNGKLNEPNNNHTNNEVNNINYFNNNSIKHNYNSNILIQRKNKNKYKNINIKNFYFFNGNNTCRRRTDNNGIFEEYIIDYKDGLNLNNFGKNNNLYKYNNCSLQNWRNKNKINNTDSHINTTSSIDGNNEKGLSQIHNNKTYKTYEHFYKVNSRGKKTKLNIGTPYKKIIVNDYSCNNSSKGKISNNISNDTNNNFKYNYKISKTQRNNTSDNFNKNNKKILRDKYNSYFNEIGASENEEKNKNYINNPNKNNINKKSNDFFLKRHSNVLNDNLQSKNKNKVSDDLEIKYINFAKHFSNYCISYYFDVITKIFKFLKSKNPQKKKETNNRYYTNTNFNKKFISSSKQFEIPKLNYGTNYRRYNNKLIERSPLNKSSSALIDKIKSKNQSLSPNSRDDCEMFRNIHELRKKCEVINSRKKILNNSSIKKGNINTSSNSDIKMINEFRLTSIEKNKEKWENTKNKERERKKSILESKKNKKNNLEIKTQNNDIIIPRLNDSNNALKNKIKKIENKNDKSIEISMNIGSITIKQKEKININDFSFGDNNKDIEIRKNKYFYDKNALLNKEKYDGNNFKKETKRKNRMINIKKITTKDKSVHVNINYMKYSPIKIKKNINNDINKLYKVCKVFNISIFGDKNGTNFNIN